MNLTRAVFALLAAASLWAQNTVAVSGRVTDAATGLPIEGATVTLLTGAQNADRQMLFTDPAGNYSSDGVAAGTVQVQIYKEGYIVFQRSNPGETSLQLTGDHLERDFKLIPAASIRGRIIRETPDQPNEKIVASLLEEDFSGGAARFVEVGSTLYSYGIGADGSFGFTGLERGRYIVSAGTSMPAGFSSSLFCRSDVGTGTPQCVAMQKAEEQAMGDKPVTGYPATYYPGTTELGEALPVTLGAGDKRVVDFKLARRPLFRASGEIDLPGTEQRQYTLIVQRANGAGNISAAGGLLPGPFFVAGLSAGQYTATASIMSMGMEGKISFAITDHNLDGLKIVPEAQLHVDSSFRMANQGTALPAGLSVKFAWPLPGESTPMPASESGHFTLTAFPGEYSVLPMVPAGYVATEIRYAGGNYLNRLIPIRGDTPDSSLTIVLTDQPGAVGGSILDGDQKPVAAKVVLVPEPLPAGFDLWAIHVVSADSKGTFAFNGLTPGKYKAVVLTGDDRKRDHDLTILGDKLRVADSFEVVAGQSVNISVRP